MLTVPEEKAPSQKSATLWPFLIALLISILFIHLPLFYFLTHHQFARDWNIPSLKKEDRVVMIDLNQTNLPRRIVDSDKPRVQKRPKKASAQSLYDASVKQETVTNGFSKKNVPYGATGTKKNVPTAATEKLNKKYSKRVKKKSPQADLDLTMQQKLLALKKKQQEEQKNKFAALYNKPKQAPLFKTNLGQPSGGGTGEFFPDYKVGNRTYLNTLANPHIAYFVELRRKFRFAFNPVPVLRARINQISAGQISVVWGVSVDKNGRISGLTLLKSSGLPAYDAEARRTIRSSSPFSSPPAHLLASDGQLHMAWTFVVYL